MEPVARPSTQSGFLKISAAKTVAAAKAAYEAYKNGLIETHQDQITYYLDAS